MTKKLQNFEMWSGNHRDLVFTTLDSDSASINLAGASVVWQLSLEPGSGSLIKRSTDSGCGISISGCTFTVSLSPVHTEDLMGNYYHEAWIRDIGEIESTVAVGTATIREDAI